jgi:hypothetical protein
MSSLLRLGRLGLVICFAAVLVPSARAQQAPGSPPYTSPGASEGMKATNPFPSVTPLDEKLPARQKLLKSINNSLGRMAVTGPNKKKDINDHWVVGIGELDLLSRNADVRFGAMQTQKPIAEYLTDYSLGAPPQAQRMWHVFARFKGPDEAERFLLDLRAQYDAMQEYRATIARIYNARSTRRC